MTVNNILVVRRDNIGDLICTTPLFSSLRRGFPTARICALVNSYNADVLSGNPDIDCVYVYKKAKHRGTESRFSVLLQRVRLSLALRRERFDYAILAGTQFSRHAWRSARLAAPRDIVGYANETERPAHGTWLAPPIGLHEVEAVHRLLQPLGIDGDPPPLRLASDPARTARMRALLPAGAGPVIGVHVSARERANQWPADRFATLIRAIAAEAPSRFMLFWSPGRGADPLYPGDDEKAAEVRTRAGVASLVPCVTAGIPDLIAGIAVCDYVIACDSGAVHIAAALQKPIVGLYCARKVRHWHPWRVPHEAVAGETVGDIAEEAVRASYRRLTARLAAETRRGD